jgi:hypothetical protein
MSSALPPGRPRSRAGSWGLALISAGAVGGSPSGLPEGLFSTAFYAYGGAVVAAVFWAISRSALGRTPPG